MNEKEIRETVARITEDEVAKIINKHGLVQKVIDESVKEIESKDKKTPQKKPTDYILNPKIYTEPVKGPTLESNSHEISEHFRDIKYARDWVNDFRKRRKNAIECIESSKLNNVHNINYIRRMTDDLRATSYCRVTLIRNHQQILTAYAQSQNTNYKHIIHQPYVQKWPHWEKEWTQLIDEEIENAFAVKLKYIDPILEEISKSNKPEGIGSIAKSLISFYNNERIREDKKFKFRTWKDWKPETPKLVVPKDYEKIDIPDAPKGYFEEFVDFFTKLLDQCNTLHKLGEQHFNYSSYIESKRNRLYEMLNNQETDKTWRDIEDIYRKDLKLWDQTREQLQSKLEARQLVASAQAAALTELIDDCLEKVRTRSDLDYEAEALAWTYAHEINSRINERYIS